MVKEVLPLTAWVLVPFKEKNYDILKLIILLEMVEIWISICEIVDFIGFVAVLIWNKKGSELTYIGIGFKEQK